MYLIWKGGVIVESYVDHKGSHVLDLDTWSHLWIIGGVIYLIGILGVIRGSLVESYLVRSCAGDIMDDYIIFRLVPESFVHSLEALHVSGFWSIRE